MINRMLRKVLGRGQLFLFLRRQRMAWRIFRMGLKHVHPTFIMGPGCRLMPDLVAGPHCFTNFGCTLQAKVIMGKYVMFAPCVTVLGGDHRWDEAGTPMIFTGRPEILPTIFEDDCWIGQSAIILQGVRIGRGSIVGAGSVVTKDVPPYEIHAGVPARKVRDRFADPADRLKHDAMLDGPVVQGKFCDPQV